ncbi:MAG: RidA family protein [Geminicoccaceae bacterium]|nr:MAG: RidA family protein [Geminicoccaceae bacterium]
MPSSPSLRPPYGRYRHVVAVEGVQRLVTFSGQIAVRADESVPDGIEAQTQLILANYDLLLAEVGLTRQHLLRLTTYLVDPADRAGFMAVRDAWVPDPPPASTLIYVAGLVNPALKVEIEALAAG